MNESNKLISVGTYLTKEEVDSITKSLTSMNINFVVNGHDAASRYQSLYYEIRVNSKDLDEARKAIKIHQLKKLTTNKQCPKCKDKHYVTLEKRGLWEKIYYYGTTLVQCTKCQTKYPI